ncbi:MAG: peptidylprolyl isomerase [Ignavibacteria bacterium]|nr:peptidylprolyl isomerase [Ignavibacteria bacterium]
MRLPFSFGLAVALLFVWAGVACQKYGQPERLRRFAALQQTSTPSKSVSTKLPESPSDSSAKPDTIPLLTHRAVIRTTFGEITIGLYGKDAPQAVENFVKLSERKFFRGILFHRVAKNFVVQTGDPKTKDKRKKDEWGSGGESAFGEPFPDEIFTDAPSVKRGYKRGTVAMANRSPDANTSQFFICLRDVPELPQQFTIFGEVLHGQDVLDSIGGVEITPQLNENDGRPVKVIAIKSVAVSKVRALARK